MGLLVDGKWQDRWYATAESGGKLRAPGIAVPRLGHARRRARARAASAASRPSPAATTSMSPRLSLGAPHADLPRAEEARGRRSPSRSSTISWARTAGLSSPRTAPPATRSTASTSCTRSTPRPIRTIPAASPCRCCGTSSSETIVSNESAEIIRMLNSAFDEWGDASLDFYPERAARRDRPPQCAGLPDRQQRRLPRRLRHHAGGL